MRSTNPPINPALLDALTQDFIEHKFDVRHLMRRIVTSATYQRSSAPNAVEPARRAELLARHSAARPGRGAAGFARPGDRRGGELRRRPGRLPCRAVARRQRGERVPEAVRQAAADGRLRVRARQHARTCSRRCTSSTARASSAGCRTPNGRPAQLLRQKLTDAELVTELYLWSLARNPNAREMKVGVDFLKSYGGAPGGGGPGSDVGAAEQQGLSAGALIMVSGRQRQASLPAWACDIRRHSLSWQPCCARPCQRAKGVGRVIMPVQECGMAARRGP